MEQKEEIQHMDTRPLMVSIRCATYNHEPYIRQCLEGFVMQKTNFRFEAIVHDDASTDGTAAIIREYAEKYPDIIKPIYETENQWSKHDGSLRRIMDNACIGKYIACCEGDDCWTDPLKLQMQVAYLEQHPECSISCHRFYARNEFTNTKHIGQNRYFDNIVHKDETEFQFDLAYAFEKEWFVLTPTVMYRRNLYNRKFLQQFKYSRDVHLNYLMLTMGKGVCHSFIGAVSRCSSASTFGSLTLKKKIGVSYNVYKELYEHTKSLVIQKLYYNMTLSRFANGDFFWPQNVMEFKAFMKGILLFYKMKTNKFFMSKGR